MRRLRSSNLGRFARPWHHRPWSNSRGASWYRKRELNSFKGFNRHDDGYLDSKTMGPQCKKLTRLDASFNELTRVTGLDGPKNLSDVKLYNNRIRSLGSSLNHATSIRVLELQNNGLESARGIEALKGLRCLRIDGNNLQDVKPIGRIGGSLRELDVSWNALSSLEGLNRLSSLEELNVSNNYIKSLSEISKCTALRDLSASSNRVKSLLSLKNLQNLDVLRVENNCIDSLEKVPESLPELTELYLAGNRVESVESLHTRCPRLDILDVSNNRMTSLKSLIDVAAELPELAELNCLGNPATEAMSEDEVRAFVAPSLPELAFFNDRPLNADVDDDLLGDVASASVSNPFDPLFNEFGTGEEDSEEESKHKIQKRILTPAEYGDIMGRYEADMENYMLVMKTVFEKIRAFLSGELNESAQAVRADNDGVTKLPRPPVMATVSNGNISRRADAIMHREAKRQAAKVKENEDAEAARASNAKEDEDANAAAGEESHFPEAASESGGSHAGKEEGKDEEEQELPAHAEPIGADMYNLMLKETLEKQKKRTEEVLEAFSRASEMEHTEPEATPRSNLSSMPTTATTTGQARGSSASHSRQACSNENGIADEKEPERTESPQATFSSAASDGEHSQSESERSTSAAYRPASSQGHTAQRRPTGKKTSKASLAPRGRKEGVLAPGSVLKAGSRPSSAKSAHPHEKST